MKDGTFVIKAVTTNDMITPYSSYEPGGKLRLFIQIPFERLSAVYPGSDNEFLEVELRPSEICQLWEMTSDYERNGEGLRWKR